MSENQIPGEENQLEQLALRLLIYPGDPRTNKPRLFLGKIPENFPLDVPIPDKSRVLGTLARSEETIEIVLESDLTSDEVMAFYREHLKGAGWSELEDEMRHHMGGFMHGGFGPHNHATFCQGSDGPSLMLNILQMEGAQTDMRLHINLGREGNPCAQQRRMRRHMHGHGMYEMIPVLSPPTGVHQRGGSGGSGDEEAYSTATLKSDVELEVLAKHYAEQLSQAGWIQTAAGTSGPLAWHTWKFTSEEQEPWRGQFFMLKTPEKEREYFLSIRVAWDNPEDDSKFTGWMSRTTFGTSSMTLKNPGQP